MNDAVAEATKKKVAENASNKKVQPSVTFNQFYLANLDMDVVTPVHLIDKEWQPDAKMDIDVQHTRYNDTHYAVEVKLAISVSMDKPIFNLKLSYAGLFAITGFNNEQIAQLLNTDCPTTIYPYLRQAVTQTTTQAGFPPLNLSHFDFHGRYQTILEQQANKKKK